MADNPGTEGIGLRNSLREAEMGRVEIGCRDGQEEAKARYEDPLNHAVVDELFFGFARQTRVDGLLRRFGDEGGRS